MPSREIALRARRSTGGSDVDKGVEYQRAVTAYVAAHGLASHPLKGFGPDPGLALVEQVTAETDDPVDDLRIRFAAGGRSYVQARRRLRADRRLRAALAQWQTAAQQGLDPDADHLVIVGGSWSENVRDLARLLERAASEDLGHLTAREARARSLLEESCPALDERALELVMRVGRIHLLDVEEVDSPGAREATLLLREVVGLTSTSSAWDALRNGAGRIARRRAGYGLGRWMTELRGAEGVELRPAPGTEAAALQRRFEAVQGHRHLLDRRSAVIDLRPLGGEIPPLDFDDGDADVRVSAVEGRNDDDGAQLIWSFLNLGHVVLTGLPGSGKSTALMGLAAHLFDLDEADLPVVASLREINALDHAESFRDRLIRVAVRDIEARHRTPLTDEINTRLTHGGMTVLLDGLDETYQDRGSVVSSLHELVMAISPDVDVVLATRDIAYGQAATLGWEQLRLLPPKDPLTTARAILRRAAAQRGEGEEWVADRLSWVSRALASDAAMRETPLVAVLLSLLAIRRDVGALPTRRPHVLHGVILDVIDRECDRKRPARLAGLDREETRVALQNAHEIIGEALVASGGRMTRTSIESTMSAYFRSDWGLADGVALTAATSAVRFWDEAGIFVASGADEMVTPRVLLFAEVGDAQRATRDPGRAWDWTRTRLAGGHAESAVLASVASEPHASALAALAADSGDHQVLHAALRAVREGASPDPAAMEKLRGAALADAGRPDLEGWRTWLALFDDPRIGASSGALVSALESFPASRVVLGRAMTDIRDRTEAEIVDDPRAVLDLLHLDSVDSLSTRTGEQDPWSLLAADSRFIATYPVAARMLAQSHPDLADLFGRRLDTFPSAISDSLSELLWDIGRGDIVLERTQRQSAEWTGPMRSLIDNFDSTAPERVVGELADHGCGGELTWQEHRRLDQLRSLFTGLDINGGGSAFFRKEQDRDLHRIMAIAQRLLGLSPTITSQQAGVLGQRMGWAEDGHAPFFAAIKGGPSQTMQRWEDVDDPEAAVDVLVRMLYWSLSDALVGARALWHVPPALAPYAAGRVAVVVERTVNHLRHQRIAAHVLAQLDATLLAGWQEDSNPVLRRVAVEQGPLSSTGKVADAVLRGLDDADGYVRAAAVECVIGSGAEDEIEVLQRIAASRDADWTCESCRTLNPVGVSACTKDGCLSASPSAAGKAEERLRSVRGAEALR